MNDRGGGLELILQEHAFQLPPQHAALAEGGAGGRIANAEQRIVALGKSLHAKVSVVSSPHHGQAHHPAGVVGEARRLVEGIEQALWAEAGGFYDHVPGEGDVAAVRYRDRPFESNADAARLLLDLYYATGERSFRALAERILATLSPLAGRYEIAGAAFALGVEEFFAVPATIVLVGSADATAALRAAAFRVRVPNLRVWTLPEGGRLPVRTFGARPAPAAYACGAHLGTAAITDPAALATVRFDAH